MSENMKADKPYINRILQDNSKNHFQSFFYPTKDFSVKNHKIYPQNCTFFSGANESIDKASYLPKSLSKPQNLKMQELPSNQAKICGRKLSSHHKNHYANQTQSLFEDPMLKAVASTELHTSPISLFQMKPEPDIQIEKTQSMVLDNLSFDGNASFTSPIKPQSNASTLWFDHSNDTSCLNHIPSKKISNDSNLGLKKKPCWKNIMVSSTKPQLSSLSIKSDLSPKNFFTKSNNQHSKSTFYDLKKKYSPQTTMLAKKSKNCFYDSEEEEVPDLPLFDSPLLQKRSYSSRTRVSSLKDNRINDLISYCNRKSPQIIPINSHSINFQSKNPGKFKSNIKTRQNSILKSKSQLTADSNDHAPQFSIWNSPFNNNFCNKDNEISSQRPVSLLKSFKTQLRPLNIPPKSRKNLTSLDFPRNSQNLNISGEHFSHQSSKSNSCQNTQTHNFAKRKKEYSEFSRQNLTIKCLKSRSKSGYRKSRGSFNLIQDIQSIRESQIRKSSLIINSIQKIKKSKIKSPQKQKIIDLTQDIKKKEKILENPKQDKTKKNCTKLESKNLTLEILEKSLKISENLLFKNQFSPTKARNFVFAFTNLILGKKVTDSKFS